MKIGITLTSSLNVGQEYIDLTRAVVSKIAMNNHSIVYGGTDYGMMKELADTYKGVGGRELIGVMSHELARVTVGYKAYENLDNQIWVKSMGERTRKIFDLSDGILALPGGYGTIEELASYSGTKANKIVDKPIVLFNYKGFYDSYISMMQNIYNRKFSKIDFKELVKVSDNLDEVLKYFESYKNTDLPDKFV